MKSERHSKVRWKRLVRVFISFGSSYSNESKDFINGGGLSGVADMYSQYVVGKPVSALLCKSVEVLLNNGHVESVSHSFCYFLTLV